MSNAMTKEKKREPRFHIVKREPLVWYKAMGIRLFAILIALVVCGIITTITTGINPISVYDPFGREGAKRSDDPLHDHRQHRCRYDLGSDSGTVQGKVEHK